MTSFDGLHHISINGVGLTVARSIRTNKLLYQRREAPTFVNKFSSGDPSYRDSSFYSHWVQLDWKNGGRQEFFNDAARFWSAQAINPTKESELRLARAYPDQVTVSGVTVSAIAGRFTSQRLHLGATDGTIYVWPSGSTVYSDYAPGFGTINDMVPLALTTGTALIAAAGSTTSSVIHRMTTADPGTWATVDVTGGAMNGAAGPVTALEFDGVNVWCAAGYRTGGPAALYKSTDGGATWTTPTTMTGYINTNDIKSYGGFEFMAMGGNGNAGSHTNSNGALLRWDGTNLVTVVKLPSLELNQLEVYDNLLFCGTTTGQIYVHNLSTFDKLFEIPGNPTITKMSNYNDELYIFTAANSGYSTVWKFDRNGFSEVTTQTVAPGAASNDLGSRGILTGGLAFAYLSGTSTEIALFSGSTTETYPTTGTNYVQSSYFDANLPSLDKIWHSLEVQYLSLPASVSVQCDYKTDDSDPSWTNLGTATSANTTRQTFLFPQGTFSKKLSYRVVLATSNSANTPKVKKVITKYVVKPDFYHLWNINIEASDNIQLVDGSYEVSTGSAIVTALSNIRRTKSLYEFRDFDYVSARISGTITSANTNIPLFQDPTATNWPLNGRIRIPSISAEVTYTSANTSALTGVAWNYKNTPFASAGTSTLIDTSYMVLNNAINEESIWNDSPDVRYEQTVPIQLLET